MKGLLIKYANLNKTLKMFIIVGVGVLIASPMYFWGLSYPYESDIRGVIGLGWFAVGGMVIYKLTKWTQKVVNQFGKRQRK